MSGEKDRVEHIEGVKAATDHLISNVIPLAAALLDQLHTAHSEPAWRFYRLSHLRRCLHVTGSLGVNRRFLGKVMQHTKSPVSRDLMLIETVARTMKKLIRALLRDTLFQAKQHSDVQVTKVATHVFFFCAGLCFLTQRLQEVVGFWNRLLSQKHADSTVSWDQVATKVSVSCSLARESF